MDFEAILVNRIGQELKAVIFRPNLNVPRIAIHDGVMAIRVVNSDTAISDYLYYQLYAPFVQKQIETYKAGGTIPNLTKSNLLSLVIPIVAVKAQKSFVDLERIRLTQTEKDKIKERLKIVGYQHEIVQKESDIV